MKPTTLCLIALLVLTAPAHASGFPFSFGDVVCGVFRHVFGPKEAEPGNPVDWRAQDYVYQAALRASAASAAARASQPR